MVADPKLIETIRLTAEIYGRQLSAGAAAIFISDLSRYSTPQVIQALSRCRMELRAFPTVADIVARIDDHRPGPEEAWAMIPKDEESSVVWTEEMRDAFAVARELISDDDPISARMAFRETYVKLVADARSNFRPAKWSPSLGLDPAGREQAIQFALQRGYLTQEHARALIPTLEPIPTKRPLLSGPMLLTPELQTFRERFKEFMERVIPSKEDDQKRQDAALELSKEEIERRRQVLRDQARIIAADPQVHSTKGTGAAAQDDEPDIA